MLITAAPPRIFECAFESNMKRSGRCQYPGEATEILQAIFEAANVHLQCVVGCYSQNNPTFRTFCTTCLHGCTFRTVVHAAFCTIFSTILTRNTWIKYWISWGVEVGRDFHFGTRLSRLVSFGNDSTVVSGSSSHLQNLVEMKISIILRATGIFSLCKIKCSKAIKFIE